MADESTSNSAPRPEAGNEANEKPAGLPICFVIMPISDPRDYKPGHFRRVYEDIITPACERAKFRAIRADDIKESNLIHLDILEKLLDAPMAVCDLSSRNPNVLFELALRQAFDKPVALIREVGTPDVFDIGPLRYTEYRKERIYDEVLEDQQKIADAIRDTSVAHANGEGVNSIVKLLALGRAALPTVTGGEASAELNRIMLSEIEKLRGEIRGLHGKVNERMSPWNWGTVTPVSGPELQFGSGELHVVPGGRSLNLGDGGAVVVGDMSGFRVDDKSTSFLGKGGSGVEMRDRSQARDAKADSGRARGEGKRDSDK